MNNQKHKSISIVLAALTIAIVAAITVSSSKLFHISVYVTGDSIFAFNSSVLFWLLYVSLHFYGRLVGARLRAFLFVGIASVKLFLSAVLTLKKSAELSLDIPSTSDTVDHGFAAATELPYRLATLQEPEAVVTVLLVFGCLVIADCLAFALEGLHSIIENAVPASH